MRRDQRGVRWLLSALALGLPVGAGDARSEPPGAALRALRPRPGFQVERVAAEPLIQSPVAFDWGPDGRLWVVEMRDYPLGLDNQGKAGGRIVCLEDADGDGCFDRSTVFLEGLLFPTGVMTWRRGALVTCAPDLFYAEDTDGDGRADRREVLFTGFGEANPQHRVNGLRWGLDNWVYCANGDFAPVRTHARAAPPGRSTSGFSPSQAEDLRRLALAGSGVRSLKSGTRYDIRNRDFRVRPEEGRLDPQSGQAQFGRDRDDWGHWFGCNHATPCWHYALDDHYLRRNPHLAAPGGRVEVPRSLTFALGRGRATGTPRNPRGNAWTSGCSVMVYRDTLFGAEFAGNWFACEPVHNLVHRERLEPAGTTFTSRRAEDDAAGEFLASEDPMFTPVSIRTGPDGALWVADMQRTVLEHPHWLPAGWEKTVDVRAGHDRGRIYRVYPSHTRPRAWPRLDRLDAAGLVALLDSPNGWLRDKAQQTLVLDHDRSVVPRLESKAAEGESALGRLHALCTLDGLGALKPEHLRRSLADRHPGIRRHALRLSEIPAAQSPDVEIAVVTCISDSDPSVRLQLAYSLGSWESAQCGRTLGRLLGENAGDPFLSAAALSSLTRRNIADAVLALPEEIPPGLIPGLLQSAVGFDEPRATVALLGRLVQPRTGRPDTGRFAALGAWLDSLDQRDTPLEQLAHQVDAPVRAELRRLGVVFEAAREAVRDPARGLPEKVQAARLLGRGLDGAREDRVVLADLLGPQSAEELQDAAVNTLARLRDPQILETLLGGWKGYTPKRRSRVLDVLLSRADGPRALLEALRGERIRPQDVPLTTRRQLLEHPSDDVREGAVKLFGDQVDPDRNQVVLAFQPALKLVGEPRRGLQVFTKSCVSCHRLGGVGQVVGPDLAMVRDKPPEWFLPALFDPSRAVDARFLHYIAVTREGRVLTGVLAEEGGNSITLVGPSGERQLILRANLQELASTGKSAMPEGLEKELGPQDVADLIAYLRKPESPERAVSPRLP